MHYSHDLQLLNLGSKCARNVRTIYILLIRLEGRLRDGPSSFAPETKHNHVRGPIHGSSSALNDFQLRTQAAPTALMVPISPTAIALNLPLAVVRQNLIRRLNLRTRCPTHEPRLGMYPLIRICIERDLSMS